MIRTLAILAVLTAAEPTADSASPKESVIDGVLSWMKTYRELPSLSMWLELDYVPLQEKTSYGWSHEELETRRQGDKLRTIPRLTNLETKAVERRDTTWDGKYCYSREPSAAEVPRTITISPHLHAWTLNYRRFDDFIFSPEGSARYRELFSNSPIEQSDYWLPSALKRNRADFVVAAENETVSGQKCVVLSRGHFDRLWIAPELGYAVCRRQVLIGPMLNEREITTASDFKNIDGLWLPHKLVREVSTPGDQPDQWIPRERKTLIAKLISTAPIDDDEFRLPTPEGVQVFDYRNR